MDVTPTFETAHRRVWFLRTADTTDGAIHEQRVELRPDTPAAPLHLHPAQDIHLEVEYGDLEVTVDGTERALRAGDRLDVPRGTSHRMRNGSSSRVAIVRIEVRPALRTAELVHAAADLGDDPGPLATAQLAHGFRDELRLAGPTAVLVPTLGRLARLTGRRPPDRT